MLGYYGLTIARIEDGHLVAIPSDKLATQTNNLFNRICADREGNIWISAAGDGAYQLIVNDSQISNYSLPVWQDKTGRLSPIVRGIFKNNAELFWINYDRIGLGWYTPGDNSLFFAVTWSLRMI